MEQNLKNLNEIADYIDKIIVEVMGSKPNILLRDEYIAVLNETKNECLRLIERMKNFNGDIVEGVKLNKECYDFRVKYALKLHDIVNFLPTEFDLLCLVDGKELRCSFEKGKDKEIIGIFPFKHSSIYMQTAEKSECSHLMVAGDYIPPIYIWEDIFRMIHSINECLERLNLPILSGNYFAKQNLMSKTHNIDMIVNINPEEKYLKYEISLFKDAKVRYFKIHNTDSILSLI